MPAQRRSEQGYTYLTSTVILLPLLMFLLMLIVQFAMVFHARNVAEQAAQEGAAVARRFDGSADAGKTRAEQFLADAAGRTVRGTSVSVSRRGQQASATVSGTVVSVVPGFELTVSESAVGPVERYVPPEDQP